MFTITNELKIGVSKDALGICSGREKDLRNKLKNHFKGVDLENILSLPEDIFIALKSAFEVVCPAAPIRELTLQLESSQGLVRTFFPEPFPACADKLFFISAFMEVLLDYCETKSGLHLLNLDKQISQLSTLYKLDYLSFIKAAKYIYAYPLAVIMKRSHTTSAEELTHLPPQPSFLEKPGVQLTGPFKRVFKNRMIGKRSPGFAFAILQGVKRGCKAVGEELFASTFAKHVLDLSAPPKVDFAKETFSRGIIQRVVDKLFPTYKFRKGDVEYRDLIKNKEISQSASYHRTRSQGGSREEVLSWLTDLTDRGRPSILPGVTQLVVEPAHLHSMDQDGSYYSITSFNSSDLFYGLTVGGLRKFLFGGHQSVTVAGISEPLKVRTITKGDAMSNFYSAPIQRILWETLKVEPVFNLIGTPLGAEHLQRLEDCRIFEVIKQTLESYMCQGDLDGFLDFNLYVSGDYTAATDNLNVGVSKEIFNRFKLNYLFENPDPIRVRAQGYWDANLFDLNVQYPKLFNELFMDTLDYMRKGKPLQSSHPLYSLNSLLEIVVSRWEEFDTETYMDVESGQNKIKVNPNLFPPLIVPMRNGQLMGSVLSFPILCIANLCCYLESLLEYCIGKVRLSNYLDPREVSYEILEELLLPYFFSLPVLINGDDIAFKTNSEHYKVWEQTLKKYGFSPSQGKNYVSPNLVTINSQLFQVQKHGGSTTFNELHYLNVGLLRGPNSGCVAARPLWVSDAPLSDFYEQSVCSSNNPERSHRRFIHYNKDIIQRITKGGYYNLFASPKLLGLGFSFKSKTGKFILNNEPFRPDHVKNVFSPVHYEHAEKCLKLWKSVKRSDDVDKIPQITFTKDDKLFKLSFSSKQAVSVVVLKPFDVPNWDQRKIKEKTSPNFFQPGVYLSNQTSTNGHFVLPKKKQIDLLNQIKIKNSYISPYDLLEFNPKVFQEFGSELGYLSPKTV